MSSLKELMEVEGEIREKLIDACISCDMALLSSALKDLGIPFEWRVDLVVKHQVNTIVIGDYEVLVARAISVDGNCWAIYNRKKNQAEHLDADSFLYFMMTRISELGDRKFMLPQRTMSEHMDQILTLLDRLRQDEVKILWRALEESLDDWKKDKSDLKVESIPWPEGQYPRFENTGEPIFKKEDILRAQHLALRKLIAKRLRDAIGEDLPREPGLPAGPERSTQEIVESFERPVNHRHYCKTCRLVHFHKEPNPAYCIGCGAQMVKQ